MSKAAKQWERHLFDRHNLIALSPLNRDLQLLDVLVKKGSHGFIRNRGPIIVRIGSILSLRKEDDNPDWEQWAGLAKDGLSRLGENKDLENNELFSAGVIGDYESNTEFSSNLLSSLSSFVGMGGDISKSWSGSALHVTYQKFTEDSAVNLFYSRIGQALWKPDLERIKLEQPSIRSDATLDLWVVKEIQYANEIKIDSSSSSGAHVEVDLPSVVAGIPISLPGDALQVKVEAKDKARVIVKGQKVPFGFKATRLVYQENGNLIARSSNMGMRMLRVAATMDSSKKDPSTFFNVDKDPMYHMGGFFSEDFGNSDNEEDGMQLLDVVTNGDGSTMAP